MYSVEHMAINTDDVDATRAFYEAVCGWQFQAWGPPGFQRAELPGGFTVAIQERRELVPDSPSVGAEPTVTVDDVVACIERAEAAGGQVLMPPTRIEGVGTVVFVADPGGNPIGLLQHE